MSDSDLGRIGADLLLLSLSGCHEWKSVIGGPDDGPCLEEGLEFTESLKRGSRGNDVRRIQEWLYLNEYEIVVDGVFGAVTEAGIRAFRRNRNMREQDLIDAEDFVRLSAPLLDALTTGDVCRRTLVPRLSLVHRIRLVRHPSGL